MINCCGMLSGKTDLEQVPLVIQGLFLLISKFRQGVVMSVKICQLHSPKNDPISSMENVRVCVAHTLWSLFVIVFLTDLRTPCSSLSGAATLLSMRSSSGETELLISSIKSENPSTSRKVSPESGNLLSRSNSLVMGWKTVAKCFEKLSPDVNKAKN
jgi:hypothetical protein